MKDLSDLRFFDFEVAAIKKLFPHEKAPLESDLDSSELEGFVHEKDLGRKRFAIKPCCNNYSRSYPTT